MHPATAVLHAESGGEDPSTGAEPASLAAEALDRAIVAVLNGAPPPPDVDGLLARSRVQGVSGLLAGAVFAGGADPDAMPGLAGAFAAHELIHRLHRARLRELLDACEAARLEVLLLKGTPVAERYYDAPALRSRGDTDLLVSPDRFREAEAILLGLGYTRCLDAGGELLRGQASFERRDGVGCLHVFDLHRRISDRQVFARAFSWDELDRNSQRLPELHRAARTLAPVHLLLHASLHRAVHLEAPYRVDGVEHRGDRLIWLHDISLIAREFTDEDWRRLTEFALGKALAAVVAQALARASERFPIAVPATVERVLGAVHGEPSSRLLTPAYGAAFLDDFRHQPGWRRGARLLWEVAFPPAAYMYARYGRARRALLPWLYLRRLVGGVRGLLGRR